jgi:hypothetical protein
MLQEAENKQTRSQAKSMSITITNNTLPYPEDQRKVEKALRAEIASLPGDYEISILAPHNLPGWVVKIRSAGGFQAEMSFVGPEEEEPTFIASAVRKKIQDYLQD